MGTTGAAARAGWRFWLAWVGIVILTACGQQAAPSMATTLTKFEYVIQPGDTCISVAEKFGVSHLTLPTENGLEIGPHGECPFIEGQTIVIPFIPTPTPYPYIVPTDDTCYSVYREVSAPLPLLLSENGLSLGPNRECPFSTGQTILVPYVPTPDTSKGSDFFGFPYCDVVSHDVMPEETIEIISELYSVPPKDILEWNGLDSEDVITELELFVPICAVD